MGYRSSGNSEHCVRGANVLCSRSDGQVSLNALRGSTYIILLYTHAVVL